MRLAVKLTRPQRCHGRAALDLSIVYGEILDKIFAFSGT